MGRTNNDEHTVSRVPKQKYVLARKAERKNKHNQMGNLKRLKKSLTHNGYHMREKKRARKLALALICIAAILALRLHFCRAVPSRWISVSVSKKLKLLNYLVSLMMRRFKEHGYAQ